MTHTKILFLDFDGPMLPLRSYKLPENVKDPWSKFDPIAVALVMKILESAGAKLVICSTWKIRGIKAITQQLESNGMDISYLHPDWKTPESNSKYNEVKAWLWNHPEVTHWCAIEDALGKENWVQVTVEDGILWQHYEQALDYLGVKRNKLIYA